MKKFSHQFSQLAFVAALSLVAFSSCSDKGEDTPLVGPAEPTPPVVNDPVVYTNAVLYYYGTETEEDESCYYRLSLYTDMKLDDMGNPVGPGQLMRLDINAPLFDQAATEFPLPAGMYSGPTNSTEHPFAPFTFNEGYKTTINLPTGEQEVYLGSYFGDVPAGTSVCNPDYMNRGSFKVAKDDKGIYTITGTVLGELNMKRKIMYEGPLVVAVVKKEEVPLTTLTGDLALNEFTKARLYDKGDSFWIQDESYRTFELRMCTDGIDMRNDMWPTGQGRMFKLEIFVSWTADVTEGLPAGTYNMAALENDGILRENVIPGNIYPGVRSKFDTPSGSWYQEFDSNKVLINYACVQFGTLTVARNGDAHDITFDFIDCSKERPHKVTGKFVSENPLPVFVY